VTFAMFIGLPVLIAGPILGAVLGVHAVSEWLMPVVSIDPGRGAYLGARLRF